MKWSQRLNFIACVASTAGTSTALEEADHQQTLTRKLTIDLFDPPQRVRIREDTARLRGEGVRQADIAAAIKEKPTVTAVQRAFSLHRRMQRLHLNDPYVLLLQPPSDYGKLRKHLNPRYEFQPLSGYQRPPL